MHPALQEGARLGSALTRKIGPLPTTISEFRNTLGANSGLRAWVDKLATTSSHGQVIETAYITAWWAHYGHNVLSLNEDLTCALLLTAAPKIVDPTALPFRSVAVRLPPQTVWLASPNAYVKGLWAVRVDYDDGSLLKVAFWTDDERGGFVVSAPEGPFIPSQVEAAARDEADAHDMLTGIQLVQNLCCWLDASGGLSQHKPQLRQRRKQKKRRERTWPKVWLLGEGIRIHPALKDRAKTPSTRVAEAEWKLRMQHVVRGHWKQQSCGPQGRDRKRLWVEPYLRGPEGKVAWSHLYDAGSA